MTTEWNYLAWSNGDNGVRAAKAFIIFPAERTFRKGGGL